jgi:hypothetical protein
MRLKETQNTLKTIPWSKIIGLRNKLAHDYGEILAERIKIIKDLEIDEDLLSVINETYKKIALCFLRRLFYLPTISPLGRRRRTGAYRPCKRRPTPIPLF